VPNQSPTKTLHLVTTGTSLLTNLGWKRGQALPARQRIEAAIAIDPRQASAELNSLLPFIEQGCCQRVHLIISATAEGKLCAQVLADFLKSRGVPQEATTVRGLSLDGQASGPQAFHSAIRSFRDAAFRVAQRARTRGEEVLVNVTAGMKIEAAVAAIVAAELGLSAYALHEALSEPAYLPTVALDVEAMMVLRVVAAKTAGIKSLACDEGIRHRLEREGLIAVQYGADGQPSRFMVTSYGRYLAKRQRGQAT